MANYLVDIGFIIIIATVIAYVSRLLKQPSVLAYLLTGVLIGPIGFKLITNYDAIYTLAEIGIAFFLFIVGLEMKIDKIKSLGKAVFLIGMGQIIFTFIFGYLIGLAFFGSSASFFIALALTFSSTMVVVKLLSDKNQIDTLHGRLIIGILIIQDIFAIFAISLLQSFGHFTIALVAGALIKGILLICVSFFASLFIIPPIFRFAARSQELLFMSAIAWCFLIALFANYLGLSLAIGAFIAGISLAQLEYSYDISSKVKPLRDFFSIIFFVSLGMVMVVKWADISVTPIIILALFVMIGNPVIVMAIMGLMGYSKKPSFLTGIGIGQASEFSLILATQAFMLGQITQQTLSVIAVITAITLLITAYLIKYSSFLYSRLSGALSVFEFRKGKIDLQAPKEAGNHYDAVLFGCDRIGFSIMNALQRTKYSFIVVDFNPEVISRIAHKGINAFYDDFSDPELFERIDISHSKLLVSTIPDFDANMRMIKKVKSRNAKAVVFVTALSINEALELYRAGADYVILPHFLGGERMAQIISSFSSRDLLKIKERHIEELFSRKELKHEHPKR